ncbi:stage III sporulation protein AF [Ectobacillus polymachus]|uniref:stage III sporulation protein AF n=1 Tax=Ectobacillus polymachus TaxID=1508806 RepID=UPI003A8993F2
MQYITDWVRSIVVFLLFATMIHLLIPNSNMQKYVKLVVSLLLIVLILTPFFTLLQTDVTKAISSFYEKGIDDKKVENNIAAKKKEIQAMQRAYILEQMAVQMKNEVSKKLESDYGMQIVHLDIAIAKDKQEVTSQKDIEAVTVTLAKVDGRQPATIEAVKKVDIASSEPPADKQMTSQVQQFLSTVWQIDESIIKLGEGRAGKTYERQ